MSCGGAYHTWCGCAQPCNLATVYSGSAASYDLTVTFKLGCSLVDITGPDDEVIEYTVDGTPKTVDIGSLFSQSYSYCPAIVLNAGTVYDEDREVPCLTDDTTAFYEVKSKGSAFTTEEAWFTWDKSTGLMTLESNDRIGLVDTQATVIIEPLFSEPNEAFCYKQNVGTTCCQRCKAF